jgi:carboxynorspermidine decarboxylase
MRSGHNGGGRLPGLPRCRPPRVLSGGMSSSPMLDVMHSGAVHIGVTRIIGNARYAEHFEHVDRNFESCNLEVRMDASLLLGLEAVETPAIVYVPSDLVSAVQAVRRLVNASGAHLLYSVKAQSFYGILEVMARHVEGFSASSTFEACLSREILGTAGTVHLTQPGISPVDLGEIARHCDYVAANSFAQFDSLLPLANPSFSLGIRVNLELNFVSDDRHAPCRAHSKLGIPLGEVCRAVASGSRRLAHVEGIHFHHNCESNDLEELFLATEHVVQQCGGLIPQLRWVNFGGGYLLPDALNAHRLADAVGLLRSAGVEEVFMEPGFCLVEKVVYLIATVLDVVDHGDSKVAVLDTTTNHMPEVYAYQRPPTVYGASVDGEHEYILAGASCLAGDLFGVYRFDGSLSVGDRIVFERVGAYTSVKASMFNGISLPTVYAYREGRAVCERRYDYRDFVDVFAGKRREV